MHNTNHVSLWLANDEDLYLGARARTQAVIAENTETEYAGDDDDTGTETLDRDGAVADLADALEAWVIHDLRPDLGAGMFSDLLSHALGDVDWRDIAGDLIDGEVEA